MHTDVGSSSACAKLLLLAFGAKRKRGLTGEDQAFDSIIELVLVAGGRIGLDRTSDEFLIC